MNITFLVGNGFDLSMGYKTSYSDFYKWYFDQPVQYEHKNAIRKLRDSIREDVESGSKYWADFEIGLGKFTKEFSSEDGDEFLAAYCDAVEHLHTYLSNLNSNQRLETITEKQLDEIRNNLCNFYQESHERDKNIFTSLKQSEQGNGHEANFRIISFNYTNFLDKFIAKIAQKPLGIWKYASEERKHILSRNVFHVHGLLDEYPIIGVNDESQILNTEFQKNHSLCTTLIKSKAIEEAGYFRYSKAEEIIRQSHIVCLWGMSMGESDKHWWEIITQWLMTNSNCHLFIFEYTKLLPSKILVHDLSTKRRTVAHRLMKYAGIPEDRERTMFQQIHVIFNTEKVLTIGK